MNIGTGENRKSSAASDILDNEHDLRRKFSAVFDILDSEHDPLTFPPPSPSFLLYLILPVRPLNLILH